MPFYIWCALAVPDAFCLMTSLPGGLSITIFRHGAVMDMGTPP